MPASTLLEDAFDRIRHLVGGVVDGLDAGQLQFRANPDANTIAWLVWHLTRIQDDHLADAFDRPQVWIADGWAERFGLPWDASETGYGQDAEAVGRVAVDAGLLRGYHEAVAGRTIGLVRNLADGELGRIVDEGWDPPVTLAVRLVSVISDDLQHVGQAAYVRGLVVE